MKKVIWRQGIIVLLVMVMFGFFLPNKFQIKAEGNTYSTLDREGTINEGGLLPFKITDNGNDSGEGTTLYIDNSGYATITVNVNQPDTNRIVTIEQLTNILTTPYTES